MSATKTTTAAKNQLALLDSAYEVCKRMAYGEEITFEDSLVFSAIGWDDERIKEEKFRWTRIISHRDRIDDELDELVPDTQNQPRLERIEQAAPNAKRIVAEIDDALEPLLEKIAKLQREAGRLTSKREKTNKRLETVTKLHEQLNSEHLLSPEQLRQRRFDSDFITKGDLATEKKDHQMAFAKASQTANFEFRKRYNTAPESGVRPSEAAELRKELDEHPAKLAMDHAHKLLTEQLAEVRARYQNLLVND
ncbi:hypothetical protein N9L06_05300 [Mariniblastus sp.]|nr:hypothetical protein [Mariniblastus sp.]